MTTTWQRATARPPARLPARKGRGENSRDTNQRPITAKAQLGTLPCTHARTHARTPPNDSHVCEASAVQCCARRSTKSLRSTPPRPTAAPNDRPTERTNGVATSCWLLVFLPSVAIVWCYMFSTRRHAVHSCRSAADTDPSSLQLAAAAS